MQDNVYTRTASDLEKKYDLNAVLKQMKVAVENSIRDLQKTENELNNFVGVLLRIVGSEGRVDTWYYEGQPSLSNLPASNWAIEERQQHLNDLYYDKLTGYVYKFDNQWIRVKDRELEQVMAISNNSGHVKDNKKSIFFETPAIPYDNGDIWLNNEDIMICQLSKSSGVFEEQDFIKSSQYTDETIANAILDELGGKTTTVLKGQVITQMAEYTKFTDLATGGSTIIAGENITTGNIKSANYVLNTAGTNINLSNGIIKTPKVDIDQDGLKLRDGTKVISDNGLMTNIIVQGICTSNSVMMQGMGPLGISRHYDSNINLITTADEMVFTFYLPSNFVIEEAKITLEHTAGYHIFHDSSITGISKNLKLYKLNNLKRMNIWYGVSLFPRLVNENDSLEEITGAFGPNGFTGTTVYSSALSSDIKNKITPGLNIFKIKSSLTIPSNPSDTFEYVNTGACQGTLQIIGYTNFDL